MASKKRRRVEKNSLPSQNSQHRTRVDNAQPIVFDDEGAADADSPIVKVATNPRGLLYLPEFCTPSDADDIYKLFDTNEAVAKSWTGLKHGGDSVKCYTGTKDGLGMYNNKYRKVWGRARNMSMLNQEPLVTVRQKLINLIANTDLFHSPYHLLTEQLIKYAKDDLFFNLHWDIDAKTKDEPLPANVNGSEFGPGCVIAALNLGPQASVLYKPRYVEETPCVLHLKPGDMYIMHNEARWDFLHGVSVAPEHASDKSRRVIVWRFKGL
eukprot:m.63940 g.63940  ORF g.63940 m.63940 type:complete len:267 (-) comp11614_c1_seq1:585-1385(-)